MRRRRSTSTAGSRRCSPAPARPSSRAAIAAAASATSLIPACVSAPLNRIAETIEDVGERTGGAADHASTLFRWLTALAIVLILAVLTWHKATEARRHARHSRGGGGPD